MDEAVLDFFPEMRVANIDSNKQAMTLEHLLSTIITVSTGKSALEFAQSHVFEPLGIADVLWRSDPNGINLGSSGLQMKATDMGKIGYIYLNGGEWDGKQVVSDTWVEASTRAQIEAGTLQEGYGYQWWVDAQGIYMALGFAGQFIFVVPGQDIVAVFTSGLKGSDFGVPEQLLKQYIIPAALSDQSLPENPKSWSVLQDRHEQLANPEAEPVPPLSQMAQIKSGNTYILDEELLGFEAIALEFGENVDQALFRLTTSNGNLSLPVGLDGVFRVTPHELQLNVYFLHAPIALKGVWRDEDSFVLYFQNVGSPDDIRFHLDFEGDEVLVHFTEETTADAITVRGRIQR